MRVATMLMQAAGPDALPTCCPVRAVLGTALVVALALPLAAQAEDSAGNVTTDNQGGQCYAFTTPTAPNYFTEQFAGNFDLANHGVRLTPDGSLSFYTGCIERIAALPTDPTDGALLGLADDDFAAATPSRSVSLYGVDYGTFYVGSNGYITFGAGDMQYLESFENHFNLPRISALFDDLNPEAFGTISWKQLADRVAVTWQDVPQWSDPTGNTFQIELFFDGTITLSYLDIPATHMIVGISAGTGVPLDFLPTNLSALSYSCGSACAGDMNCDGLITFADVDWFVEALAGESAWTHAPCPWQNSDCSGDGNVTFADIDALVTLIGTSCP
jgi:hypothetical protein